MKTPISFYLRKASNNLMIGIILLLSGLALVPLISTFLYVVQKGAPALSFDFFTELPKPVGEFGGGIGHSLVGSIFLLTMGSLIGVPWGLLVGTYLSEYGKSKLASGLRFCVDLLTSVPSIIVGLFVYALLVKPFGGFSGYAGAAAMAIIMMPVVARSTEEVLKLIPDHIREAGLALGVPRWKVILRIVLAGSRSGLVTGIMLAVARALGETAPMLFTAFSNQSWARSMSQPVATLPVQIYTYAISPFEEWHRQAWAGAFVLLSFVFLLNLLTRVVAARGTAR